MGTKEEYIEMLSRYMSAYKEQIIDVMLKKLDYETLEDLKKDEYNLKFGLSCGWILLTPRDTEVRKEWEKANGWDSLICPVAYASQSTILQLPQVEYVVDKLGWTDLFWIKEQFD